MASGFIEGCSGVETGRAPDLKLVLPRPRGTRVNAGPRQALCMLQDSHDTAEVGPNECLTHVKAYSECGVVV